MTESFSILGTFFYIKLVVDLSKNIGEAFTIKFTVNTVFSIAHMAYELFESSKIEQKRKLISYVFSNLELEGVTLRYSLRKPFDLMVDCSTRSDWLGLLYTLRTPDYYNYLVIENNFLQDVSLSA